MTSKLLNGNNNNNSINNLVRKQSLCELFTSISLRCFPCVLLQMSIFLNQNINSLVTMHKYEIWFAETTKQFAYYDCSNGKKSHARIKTLSLILMFFNFLRRNGKNSNLPECLTLMYNIRSNLKHQNVEYTEFMQPHAALIQILSNNVQIDINW